MEIDPLALDRALRVQPDASCGWPCVALVGAGGKTTALFQLARALAQRAGGVLVTTTTHLGLEQAAQAGQHFRVGSAAELAMGLERLEAGEVILFTGPALAEEARLGGLSEALAGQLAQAARLRGLPLLVEADGARRKPLKAPAAQEPAIPDCAELVVVCAGLSGLGQPVEESRVHRAEIFARLAGLAPGEGVSPQALARVLAHAQGGLKGIRPGMRRALLLNQADTPALEAQGRQVAELLQGAYPSVLVAALAQGGVRQVWEQTAAIVLAAGEAQRFGKPKQLLELEGQPLVRRAARLALSAGLDPVIVVTGAYSHKIQPALQGLPVRLVENPAWAQGQSSSLQAGLRSLEADCGGAIFMLADQPYVSVDLLRALVTAHARSLSRSWRRAWATGGLTRFCSTG